MLRRFLVTLILLLFIQYVVNDPYLETEIKYDLQLSEFPMSINNVHLNALSVFSKFGQEFSCSIPHHNYEFTQSEVPSLNNTHLASLLAVLNTSECLSLQRGWWTYELCYKRQILQFHAHENERLSMTNLGNYESDFDWEQSPTSNNSRPAYHIQLYTNGSLCDITGKPRRSEVQYLCTDSPHIQLISVDEPETCVYVLRVSVPSICQHPYFSPQKMLEPLKIHCQPVLVDEEFRKYRKAASGRELANEMIDKNPLLKSPTISNSSHVYSLQRVHQRLVKSRNQSILRQIKKLTRRFLDRLDMILVQYKQPNALLPIQWLKYHNMITYDHLVRIPLTIDSDYVSSNLPASWSSFTDLRNQISNWTEKKFRDSVNADRSATISKSMSVMILLGKTLTSHLELFTNSIDQRQKNLDTVKLLVTTNFTDLFDTLGQLSNILLKIRDPGLIDRVSVAISKIYEQRNLDASTGLLKKIPTSFESDSLLFKPIFDAIQLKPVDQLKMIDRMRGIMALMVASMKVKIMELTIAHHYLEQSEVKSKIAEQLESTILNALGRLDFKVLMVHDINQSYESLQTRAANKKKRSGSRHPSPNEGSFQSGDVIKIIQRALQNFKPQNSEEFEVYESSNSPPGMASYYIMPSGRKRKEERRIKQLHAAYNFDWKSKSEQLSDTDSK